MPLTVFDTKGISANRRERIEAAVEAGRCEGLRRPLMDRLGGPDAGTAWRHEHIG
jgi:hypothetical protein